MKWILVIWFSGGGNYAYIPVVVTDYTTKEACQSAGEIFAKNEIRVPKYKCLPKPQ